MNFAPLRFRSVSKRGSLIGRRDFVKRSLRSLGTFEISLANQGRLREMKTLGFFCVAVPRRVVEEVGLLDERFGLGYFEDDDYCRRVESAGYQIACAEDVFVQHRMGAAFSQLAANQRRELMERNQRLYEEKWGSWTPHRYR